MPRRRVRAKRIHHDNGTIRRAEDPQLMGEAQMEMEAENTAETGGMIGYDFANGDGGYDLAQADHDSYLLDHLHHPTAQGLRLQAAQRLRRMGNQAMLQRQSHPPDAGVSAAAEEAAMQTFLNRGVLPGAAGLDMIGDSGRGGFNARWDPNDRALIVTMNIGFTFIPGLNIDAAGTVTANTAPLNATNDANVIGLLNTGATNVTANFPNVADRTNEVNTHWTWGGEKATWMSDYSSLIRGAWGGQYHFRAKRWPELLSSVRLELNVHEGKQPGDHCHATIAKTPDDVAGSAVVHHQGHGATTTTATDQLMTMTSASLRPRADNLLNYRLQFQNDSADINTAVGVLNFNDPGPAYLNKFIASFRTANAAGGTPIHITGHASSTGSREHNMRLSEDRALAVENYLRSNGLNGAIDRRLSHSQEGEEGATEDATWRRVDLVVGDGKSQVAATHEFGHLLGLDDEYVSPTGGFNYGGHSTVGATVGHNTAASRMGGGVTGAVAENNDNIMSLGTAIQPQHYATFHNALQTVTGEQWEIGSTARPVTLPATGGPNATPPPGTATA